MNIMLDTDLGPMIATVVPTAKGYEIEAAEYGLRVTVPRVSPDALTRRLKRQADKRGEIPVRVRHVAAA